MRHAKKPLLIAAYHPPWHGLQKSAGAVREILDGLDPSVPRRVFIEFDGTQGRSPKEIEKRAAFDPFCAAPVKAKEYGWQVIPLDRDANSALNANLERILGKKGLMTRYANKNLREKHWAQKVRRMRISHNDIIIMHPNHVGGFLQQARLPVTIHWVNKAFRQVVKKLRRHELVELKKIRSERRTERRLSRPRGKP